MKKYSLEIMFVIIGIVMLAMMFVPCRTTSVNISSNDVKSNYVFAGDIVVDNNRIHIGTELCAELWLNKPDSMHVVINKNLVGIVLGYNKL